MEKNRLKSSLDWCGILKTLADENRLQIISELLIKESSVNNLADTLGMKVYNISRHLKILESGGLVNKRKEGNRRIYKITDSLKSRLSDDKQILDLGCCKFMFKNLKN